jgi:hypothetical protein
VKLTGRADEHDDPGVGERTKIRLLRAGAGKMRRYAAMMISSESVRRAGTSLAAL